MLYKNDEQYKLNPKEVEAIVKHFHNKFPVKVVYPPDRIVKSRLSHNKLPDSPNSISFDLKSVVRTDSGAEVWRYAEEIRSDGKGNKKYTPKKFRFNGSQFLQRADIDLIFFLLKKSEYCLGGDNQGKMVKFMFEDLVSEAEKKTEKKELESKISMLLYNKEFGLAEEKLRAVAKAYFVKNVDMLTLAQVKIVIETKIHETKGGAERFFEMVNADEELQTRGNIQKAIDMGIIFHDVNKKSWYWKTAEGKSELICKVPPTKSNHDALYDLFMGDKSFQDNLQAALITKKPKAGKNTGEGGADADEKE
jgi:hypothetical protein